MENKELVVIDNNGALTKESVALYFELDNKLKELKAQQDDLKARILEYMEANGVLRLVAEGNVVVDYYAESESQSLDTSAIKKECPEIVAKYSKASKKSAFIKIWTKKVNERANVRDEN